MEGMSREKGRCKSRAKGSCSRRREVDVRLTQIDEVHRVEVRDGEVGVHLLDVEAWPVHTRRSAF